MNEKQAEKETARVDPGHLSVLFRVTVVVAEAVVASAVAPASAAPAGALRRRGRSACALPVRAQHRPSGYPDGQASLRWRDPVRLAPSHTRNWRKPGSIAPGSDRARFAGRE